MARDTSSPVELLDRVYVHVELLEDAIRALMLKNRPSEGDVYVVLDNIQRIYDLIADLRRTLKEKCLD